jgi:hypothetical protein
MGVQDTNISRAEATNMARRIATEDNLSIPQVKGVLTTLGEMAHTITGNFISASKVVAPVKMAFDKDEIPKAEFDSTMRGTMGSLIRAIGKKLLWFFYSNPYSIMMYRHATEDDDPQERVLRNAILKSIGGEFDTEEEKGDFTDKEAGEFLRKNALDVLDKEFHIPDAYIANAEGVSDEELMEATQIANGALKLVKPQIEASINASNNLETAIHYWKRMLTGDGSQDEHMFSGSDRAPVKAWLTQARRTLGEMSPKGQETVFIACALKGFSTMSVLTGVTMPVEVWQGNPYMLSQPPKEGKGRVRHRRLRGGNLSVKYQQLKNKLKKAYDFGERTEMGVHYHNYKEVQMDKDDPYNEKRIDAYLLGLIDANPFATYKDQIKSKAMEVRGYIPQSEEVLEQGWIDKIERLAVEDIERKNRIYDEYLDSETKKWKAPPMGLTAEIAKGDFPRRRPKSPEVPRPSAPTEEGRRGRQPSQAPPEGKTMGVEKGEASGEGKVRRKKSFAKAMKELMAKQ